MIYNINYDYLERRVVIDAENCKLRTEISETDTGNMIYACDNEVKERQSQWVATTRRWHCNMTIKVFHNGELKHFEQTTLNGKNVYVLLDSKALGDTLAWFPYVMEFGRINGCNLIVATFHNYLLHKYESSSLRLVKDTDFVTYDVGYKIGVFNDADLDPRSFRTKPLGKCAADILGVPYREHHLDLRHLSGKRPIKERYAVICTTSTMGAKEWQNADGWQGVVDYLKEDGYKVICIPPPRKPLVLKGLEDIQVPEDLVQGALTYIRYAELFVGLGSGLSWLARTLNVPLVMLSGFSEPFAEFKTGVQRVLNRGVCHGCYNDQNIKFDRYWGWCPRNKNFECTRRIESRDVISAINIMPTKKAVRTKVMCVLPHCSTGGLPQYFLEKLKIIREIADTYVVEWAFHGEGLNVQRDKIRELCTEFIELGSFRHKFKKIVDDVVPDYIHFEEFPSSMEESHMLYDFIKKYKRTIYTTSHGSGFQKTWNSDRYIFPSAYHLKLYPYTNGEVIEYPIFGKSKCEHEKAVLNVGIISKHKNQGYLCEIAKLMPDTTFYFAGSFADNFADYWNPVLNNKPKNCKFLGQQNEEQISALYDKCKIMCHPSLLELCPIVFNEAISHGCKIYTNWINTYDCLSYKDSLNRLTMNPEEDAKLLQESLNSEQTIIPIPTYSRFEEQVSSLYQ